MIGKQSIIFYHDIIDCIIAALEARDRNTADHSRRVSDMCEQVCRLMQLSQDETEKIHMAAHVHDIGKIGIADSVLMKPGPLSEDEWKLVMEHPEIGANILSRSRGLSEIAHIVLCHHERWDGVGYPNKIKQEDIPLGARIIAICDSIDAMMSERAYRRSLTSEQCQNEIVNNSGIIYDPAIVSVVTGNWESVVEYIHF
jgi:HD-GYP domain-containing protein (c-di-GMP phosphodiesterase class II)